MCECVCPCFWLRETKCLWIFVCICVLRTLKDFSPNSVKGLAFLAEVSGIGSAPQERNNSFSSALQRNTATLETEPFTTAPLLSVLSPSAIKSSLCLRLLFTETALLFFSANTLEVQGQSNMHTHKELTETETSMCMNHRSNSSFYTAHIFAGSLASIHENTGWMFWRWITFIITSK